MQRAETGPMQFGDDWPGVFIRGDNAVCGYAAPLALAIAELERSRAAGGDVRELMVLAPLRGLLTTLMSCDARQQSEVQRATLETPRAVVAVDPQVDSNTGKPPTRDGDSSSSSDSLEIPTRAGGER